MFSNLQSYINVNYEQINKRNLRINVSKKIDSLANALSSLPNLLPEKYLLIFQAG